MIRKLLIVATSALVLAIVTLGTAWVIGGRDVIAHLEKQGTIKINIDTDSKTPKITRSLPLDPARPLVISAPVELRYVRGAGNTVVVEGPANLVNALVWEGGELKLPRGIHTANDGLSVVVTAPVLPALEINGAGDIELPDLQQPALSLKLAGAASIDGSGKVDRLVIDSKGAGDIDFHRLLTTDADVSIAGASDVDVNVSGTLDAAIAGAGNISLHRKPAKINSSIAGIGSINESF